MNEHTGAENDAPARCLTCESWGRRHCDEHADPPPPPLCVGVLGCDAPRHYNGCPGPRVIPTVVGAS